MISNLGLFFITDYLEFQFYFSEQQLVDCNTDTADGCDGGDPYWALKWYGKAGGAATTAAYGPSTNQVILCSGINQLKTCCHNVLDILNDEL